MEGAGNWIRQGISLGKDVVPAGSMGALEDEYQSDWLE